MERCTLKRKIISTLVLTLALSFINPLLTLDAKAEAAPPTLSGKAAISIDGQTGEIIYAQNIDQKMYPASTTKLMTALLFAENKKKEDVIPYTESAKKQPQYSLNTNFKPIAIGETMSAQDVMKALMLFSANDSAYMIADSVANNSAEFIKLMNEKAKALNLKGTNFVTPNGLHDDNHYTTAYDLALIQKAAYENPWVKETIGIKKDSIRTSAGTVIIVENRNKLLGKDGNIGGKTGSTTPAGKCLTSVYERDGRTIIGVVLKSVYDKDDTFVFNDMEKLVNWSFEAKPTTLFKKDTAIKTVPLEYKLFRFFGPTKTIEVPLVLKEDMVYYDNEINKKETTKDVQLNNLNPWKLTKDAKAATLVVSERNTTKKADLYSEISSKEIIKANRLVYIVSSLGAIIVLIVLALLIAKISTMSRRRRRRRY